MKKNNVTANNVNATANNVVSISELMTDESLNTLRLSMLEKGKAFFHLDPTTTTAADATAARESLEAATAAYNDGVVTRAYQAAAADDNPVAFLCRARHYTSLHVINHKKEGIKAQSRTVRFNLFDFFQWVENNKDISVNGISGIKDAISAFVEVFRDYIRSSIQKDEAVGIKSVVASLEALCRLLDVEGVHGRKKDVRFLMLACMGADKTLGCLKKVTPATVAPYLMDMMEVQLKGKEYDFASSKKTEE